MNDEADIVVGGDTVAKLARGVRLRDDEVRGQKVLLAPERAMALDEIAVRIVEALDGERSIDRIADDFAAEFGAPRDQIAGDVTAFVQELADRRMLEVLS
jgi:pyrroloquinoline quinone biosynthesis protein D